MNNENKYGFFYTNKEGKDILYATYKDFKMLQKAIIEDEILWKTVEAEATTIKIVEIPEEKKDKE